MGEFGAFGKIPALGDFFRVSGGQGFVAAWDAWLQAEMLAASDHLGSGWDSHYMSAPIWRFVVGAGQAGSLPVLGILMPSVDRVGRKFPLTLYVQLEQTTQVADAFIGAQNTFEHLERIALDALEDGYSREQLAEDLSTLDQPNISLVTNVQSKGQTKLFSADTMNGVVSGFVGLSLAGYSAPCIWTAQCHDGFHSMITDGLPSGDQTHALFDLETGLWNSSIQDGTTK